MDRMRRLLLFMCTLACMQAAVAADRFPSRSIRVVVPYPAGGSLDLLARALAPKLSAHFGQPVVIDNRPGASGTIGAAAVARAAPDGYLVGLGAPATHTVPVAVGMRLPYDPQRDFTPLALLAKSPICIVVHPSLPVRTLPELVALARQKPDTLFFGSSGNGSSLHLLGEMLNQAAGTRISHVAYKGGADQITAAVGGQTQASILPLQNALPHIAAGRLRALAVFDDMRHPALPQVPTAQESFPDLHARASWIAAFAPPGLRPEIARRWSEALVSALSDAQVQQVLDANALMPAGGGPDVLARLVAEETTAWVAIARRAHIKLGER